MIFERARATTTRPARPSRIRQFAILTNQGSREPASLFGRALPSPPDPGQRSTQTPPALAQKLNLNLLELVAPARSQCCIPPFRPNYCASIISATHLCRPSHLYGEWIPWLGSGPSFWTGASSSACARLCSRQLRPSCTPSIPSQEGSSPACSCAHGELRLTVLIRASSSTSSFSCLSKKSMHPMFSSPPFNSLGTIHSSPARRQFRPRTTALAGRIPQSWRKSYSTGSTGRSQPGNGHVQTPRHSGR